MHRLSRLSKIVSGQFVSGIPHGRVCFEPSSGSCWPIIFLSSNRNSAILPVAARHRIGGGVVSGNGSNGRRDRFQQQLGLYGTDHNCAESPRRRVHDPFRRQSCPCRVISTAKKPIHELCAVGRRQLRHVGVFLTRRPPSRSPTEHTLTYTLGGSPGGYTISQIDVYHRLAGQRPHRPDLSDILHDNHE